LYILSEREKHNKNTQTTQPQPRFPLQNPPTPQKNVTKRFHRTRTKTSPKLTTQL